MHQIEPESESIATDDNSLYQQNNLHSIEENASSFMDDTNTHCDFSIVDHNSDTENTNDTHTHLALKYPGIHSQRKHIYRNTFDD